MDKNRLVTYSLLAHINNTGTLVKGLIDIFIPLTKRALSKMNQKGIFSGKSISEIQVTIVELYSIDIPIPVLKNILFRISEELNTKTQEKFILYGDGSFSIQNYLFDEFESLIEDKRLLIEEVEKLFQEFCKMINIDREVYTSIFSFLEMNKISISKYLNEHHSIEKRKDFSIEAQFVAFFKKIPKIYNTIKELYLGAILSTYIEYSTKPIDSDIELLLDTNFIVSLFDLNTPESTDSCKKLIDIAKHNGYKLSVLTDTIEETQRLLLRRAEHFNESFLSKKINPEDIYNACERRGLTKTDLENISDNVQERLNVEFGIIIIHDTTKYSNIARFSSEYKKLKEYRHNKKAALHDATAIYYVKEMRANKRYKAFENVNCWFVNNSVNTEFEDFSQCDKVFKNGYQPEIIKVDILLNILWLSNPNAISNIKSTEIVNVGLPALISSTLNESLPRNSIIRELDDNIHKYAQDTLSDEQVVRVATRIANKQLVDIESLNKLAKENKEEFIKRLEKEAKKQEEIEKKQFAQIEKVISSLQKETESLKQKQNNINDGSKVIDSLRKRLKDSEQLAVDKENKIREIERKLYLKKKIYLWRRSSWFEFFFSLTAAFFGIFLLLLFSNWNMKEAGALFKDIQGNMIISLLFILAGTIFSAIVLKSLFNKYRNHANIKAFKEQIEIPESMKEIKPSR